MLQWQVGGIQWLEILWSLWNEKEVVNIALLCFELLYYVGCLNLHEKLKYATKSQVCMML